MSMSEARRRAAIGVFATTADIDAVTTRLRSQGVRCCTWCPIAQAVADMGQGRPALSAATMGDLRTRYPQALMLRVDLHGSHEEALVAQTLLDSPAQSVQLHDL